MYSCFFADQAAPGNVRHSYQELCGRGGCRRFADPGVQPERHHLRADCRGRAQTALVLAEAKIHPYGFQAQRYISRRPAYKARYTSVAWHGALLWKWNNLKCLPVNRNNGDRLHQIQWDVRWEHTGNCGCKLQPFTCAVRCDPGGQRFVQAPDVLWEFEERSSGHAGAAARLQRPVSAEVA